MWHRIPIPRSRAVRAACVAAVVGAGIVIATGTARADSTVDQVLWSNCQLYSTASLSFGSSNVNWLTPTTLTDTVNLYPDCGNNTRVEIVEDTPQSNDNPQVIQLGNIVGGPFTATRSVLPLRSLAWSLRLVNALGTRDIATANINITYPAGPVPDGQAIVPITSNTPDQRWLFVREVETQGATVTVAGDVSLDLSGLDGITLASGVSIIGDRSANPLGPLLYTTTEPANLFDVPLPAVQKPPYSHEHISGIRLRGGSSTDPFQNMGNEDSNAIKVEKPNVEIDHNEIYLWRGAGVAVQDCDDCPTPRNIIFTPTPGVNSSTIWIHDNYIHHDQHPTGDLVPGGHGGGYGVEVDHGAYALVEQNVFDYNRHAMMGGGGRGDGYLFLRNVILPNGGIDGAFAGINIYTHPIDMHGTVGCDFYGLPIPGDHMCGLAGQYMDIEYNTVWYYRGSGVKLRGIPDNEMEVRNNEFTQCSLWDTTASCNPALEQTQFGLVESGNTLNAPIGGDARTTCDFDGDGVNDTFHATGVTMWFESSRMGGRYVYLAQSNATGARLQIGDRTGDGICDLTIDGTLLPTDPAATVITTRTTVPPLVGLTTEAAARSAIAAAGLTAGTTTYVQSLSRPGTVLAQSASAGYVRPTGWVINITVSNGQTTVPRVLSLDQASAQTAITNAGLTVGRVSTLNNCVDPGSVQTQNPSPGVTVALDTPVNITVSTCVSTGGGGGGTGGGGTGGGGNKPPILPK